MIPGPNIMLVGASGAGKTHSTTTLAEAGITPFYLFTEPHGPALVQKLIPDQAHWMYVPPTVGDMETLMTKAQRMTSSSWSVMQQQTADPQKAEYTSYYDLVCGMHNFVCARTGEEFGDVTDWGTDRAIILDSLTGLNKMAMQLVSGGSIAKSQPQWGAAMQAEMGLIDLLCCNTTCTFILIAHLERQVDEVFGGNHLVPLALGKKTAPELPKNMSDVVHVTHEDKKFFWNTIGANIDLKANNLQQGENLPPSFRPLIEAWQAGGGEILPTPKEDNETETT